MTAAMPRARLPIAGEQVKRSAENGISALRFLSLEYERR